MSGLFARQAWASASKLRSTALRAPKTAFACKVNSIAPRRCFSVSMNRTIGISNYAAEALGDVVYVELPSQGEDVSEGESFGSVESVKSASDINSPVSGSVVAVNDPIVDTPADLGKDPEGEGWLIKVEAEDVSALDSLMDEAAYAKHLEEH
ncbi:hypothetical protein BFJ68_g3879 [Fusarium oxysporum]|uniref:Glycine cleavage system H protein n=1 Tax=Fusarium oxysporum TaxID=5507 RepID=A0A420RPC4_FUSOX|nr:hypothetical protein BFJ68_g3879 [Fusarium oxysporum]